MAYKAANATTPLARAIRLVLSVGVLLAIGVAIGRATMPVPELRTATPPPAGLRTVDGLPTGFPGSPRGAGEAAAAFEAARTSWNSGSRDAIRARLQRLVDPATPSLVDTLMPSPIHAGNPNIDATVPLLVWTSTGRGDGAVPEGATVTVKVYELGLLGARGDGTSAPQAGLAGGFTIATIDLRWTGGSWRLSAYALETAAPVAIDPAGAGKAMPPILVGPDTWAPEWS
ncbi:hypothetical protein AB0M43_37705 [Longispora sp. NPDC051575]|uniref:hypothetical protein n=1 Tax=Longispora sp. NPDC051575 TaxID=3154943 RepID=UPI0034381823